MAGKRITDGVQAMTILTGAYVFNANSLITIVYPFFLILRPRNYTHSSMSFYLESNCCCWLSAFDGQNFMR